MYYEEKVVDGILCYRYDPDDGWTEFSKEVLTTKYIAMTEENKIIKEKYKKDN